MRARGVALVAEALAEAVDQSSALLEHLAVLASRGCNAAVLGYQSVAWMKAAGRNPRKLAGRSDRSVVIDMASRSRIRVTAS